MIINTELLLAAYPVGSLYLTTNNINPGTIFGGTWEQLTGDAYLKIVTSNPGQYDGTSSDHKIPEGSMPKHRHANPVAVHNGGDAADHRSLFATNAAFWSGADWNNATTYAGNSDPYYPYYYGIYAWRRTA